MHHLLTVEYPVLKDGHTTFPFRFSQIMTHHIHMWPYMNAGLACPFMKVFSFFISQTLMGAIHSKRENI
jgi:hypothetical protein